MSTQKDKYVSPLDEALYDQVAAELASGDLRSGLWLKANADATGDEMKAKALYVGFRVAQLKADVATNLRAEADSLRRLKRSTRSEAQVLAAETRRKTMDTVAENTAVHLAWGLLWLLAIAVVIVAMLVIWVNFKP